eukprot:gene7475-46_t
MKIRISAYPHADMRTCAHEGPLITGFPKGFKGVSKGFS